MRRHRHYAERYHQTPKPLRSTAGRSIFEALVLPDSCRVVGRRYPSLFWANDYQKEVLILMFEQLAGVRLHTVHAFSLLTAYLVVRECQ